MGCSLEPTGTGGRRRQASAHRSGQSLRGGAHRATLHGSLLLMGRAVHRSSVSYFPWSRWRVNAPALACKLPIAPLSLARSEYAALEGTNTIRLSLAGTVA